MNRITLNGSPRGVAARVSYQRIPILELASHSGERIRFTPSHLGHISGLRWPRDGIRAALSFSRLEYRRYPPTRTTHPNGRRNRAECTNDVNKDGRTAASHGTERDGPSENEINRSGARQTEWKRN